MRRNGITIGVMAKAPVPGRCKTRLAAHVGSSLAADLCRAMLLDTLAHIEASFPRASTRLVVMAAPEDDGEVLLRALVNAPWEVVGQRGDDLGARLSHAVVDLELLAAKGDVIALVDADSPTAPWPEAARVLATLTTHATAAPDGGDGACHACMGPCEDGGYWLIAMTSPSERGVFEEISWSTDVVAQQTRDRCRALDVALEEIALAYDIDEPKDIERLRAELAIHPSRAPRTAALFTSISQASSAKD